MARMKRKPKSVASPSSEPGSFTEAILHTLRDGEWHAIADIRAELLPDWKWRADDHLRPTMRSLVTRGRVERGEAIDDRRGKYRIARSSA